MKVLSVFDGMACGMIAMILSGVKIDEYVAYEIDKYAIKTSQHNFPMMQHKGDVFKADFTEYKDFDFLVGGSPCFTKGHLVLTDKGYKDISEIQIGDMVLTHTGKYQKVVRTNERIAPTLNVNIMGYPTFTTTHEHPFYTITKRKATCSEYVKSRSWRVFDEEPKWLAAKDLTKNQYCGQHIINTYSGHAKMSLEDYWLLGRYVADGHIRKDRRKERKSSFHYQLIISVGADKLENFKNHITERHYSCFKHTKNVYRCVFSSMDLVNKVIDDNYGRHASEKRIPEEIFTAPLVCRQAFLEGYLSGDGCWTQNKWTAFTVSKELAFGLQRLATSIYGTNVSVTESKRRISNIDNREINYNYVPYTILIPTEIKKESKCYVSKNIVWTQVKSVEETGIEETVYNIEVENDNSYTVNNCIVHNCTYWSIAQTKNRETVASGLGWDLFSQYVRALHEAKPKYFIYENNKSMSAAIRQSITETFGFEPICINSALVSAQNRQRLYWVGIRRADGTYRKAKVEQPEDRGILLKDILETNAIPYQQKADVLTASYDGAVIWNSLERHQRTMVAEPINVDAEGKSRTLKAQYYKNGIANFVTNDGFDASAVAEPVCVAQRGRNPENPSSRVAGEYLEQRFEARDDGKTNTLTTVSKDNMIAEPFRAMNYEIECVTNSDSGVIAIMDMPGSHDILKRVYGEKGKAPTINTCGGGNTEPKVFTQLPECFRVREATKKGYAEIPGGGA